MLMLAFYLSIVLFFIPKQIKKVLCYVPIALITICFLITLFSFLAKRNTAATVIYLGSVIDPIFWIKSVIRNVFRLKGLPVSILNLVSFVFYYVLAFIGLKISFIRHEESEKSSNSQTIIIK